MMAEQRKPQNMTLNKAAMWQAVRLPLRLRILETARRLGETSVTELAEAVGLNRTALYFHLRMLEKVGLLESRAGEPTPGRRGKRPRYYKATVDAVEFTVDPKAKRDATRVGDFYKPWFSESQSAATASAAAKDRRVAVCWENFTEEEASRLRSIFKEVEDVVRRARNRANSTRKAPAANMHVSMTLAPVSGHVMPGPEIRFKSK